MPIPATERELLDLPYEDYIAVCHQVALRNHAFLGDDPALWVLLEAGWERRYWMAKNGRWEYAN